MQGHADRAGTSKCLAGSPAPLHLTGYCMLCSPMGHGWCFISRPSARYLSRRTVRCTTSTIGAILLLAKQTRNKRSGSVFPRFCLLPPSCLVDDECLTLAYYHRGQFIRPRGTRDRNLAEMLRCISIISILAAAAAAVDHDHDGNPCLLYLAESTIPGAGLGMFAGKDFNEGELVGRVGDPAFPTGTKQLGVGSTFAILAFASESQRASPRSSRSGLAQLARGR